MYVLVTGGAGFIGSSIANKLVELNYKVLILDNLHTGRKKNISKKAKFIKCNLQSYTTLKKIFQKLNIYFKKSCINYNFLKSYLNILYIVYCYGKKTNEMLNCRG